MSPLSKKSKKLRKQSKKNTLDRFLITNSEKLGLKDYHGYKLENMESKALYDLEKLYGQKLHFLDELLPRNGFGIFIKNNHVKALLLTKYTLKGFIPITKLPDSLGLLKHLSRLDIKLTKIDSLPDFIKKFSQLEYLDLSHNKISKIPSFITQCEKLKILNLSYNDFLTFPKILSELNSLKTLDVSFNSIKDISGILGNLINLTALDLSNNQLRTIPSFIKNLKNLSILDLHGNNIDLNNENLKKYPKALKHLYIYQNPICQSQELKNFKHLQKIMWFHFISPAHELLKSPLLSFCPKHEKKLNIYKEWINKVKGWFQFMYKCPIPECTFKKKAEISCQLKIEEFIKKQKYIPKSVYIKGKAKCPPHNFLYIQIGDRLVYECSKCGKKMKDL